MIRFNDTANRNGIIQEIEREIGAQPGDISGSANRLLDATAGVNLALDDFTALAIRASGTWQYDDSNQTDYPIIKTNIVSGQRDYSVTTDGSGNLVLDIYKVAILPSATATQYREIAPVDAQSDGYSAGRFNDATVTGTPYDYDKTANGIIFGTVPDYDAANGLLLYVNRESSHFASTDTTKTPGIPGIFHKYLVVRPAEDFARRNNHANYPLVRAERLQMEQDIQGYYGRRERDVRKQITSRPIQGGFR